MAKKTNTKKPRKGGYISRTQAVRYLQVSLADFRRLCILKGIFPRELSGRAKQQIQKGSTKPVTAYYRKDIQYLLHEPLLDKFRQHKIFARKLTRALGRGDLSDAQRIDENRPRYTLDHIIKERYPTFLDALGDLDDALSMLFLFATMPATDKVSARITQDAERLSTEWMAYVAREHLLRKVFVSIKGVYYQASVKGQDIRWVVPFKFPQNVPDDIDFRIMLTFLEFYTTLVHFVLYRLYTEQGLVYPPPLRESSANGVGGISAYILETQSSVGVSIDAPSYKASKAPKQLGEKVLKAVRKAEASAAALEQDETANDEAEDWEESTTDALDTFESVGEDGDSLSQPTAKNDGLFSKLKFFVGREVPLDIVEFSILSFGGKMVSESALDELVDNEDKTTSNQLPSSLNTTGITHQISDRPAISDRVPGRVYVQPQWLLDSINQGELLPVGPYAPGEALPPHLSPWGDRGNYEPTQTSTEKSGDETSQLDAEEVSDENEGDEIVEDEEAQEDEEDERDLRLEASGVRHSEAPISKEKKHKKRSAVDEEKELRKMMMSNKQRRLYDKMQYGNNQKQNREDALRTKRRKIDALKKKKAASS